MGRNAAQNQQTKERRREEILVAAVSLFATKGLAATNVSDIARASGMSQGLLYHYFQSKEDIYVDIIGSAFAKLNDACRQLESSAVPPREKISSALDVLISNLDNHPDAARYHVLITQASLSPVIPERAKQIIAEQAAVPYLVFQRILAAGQQDGSVRPGDPEQLATAFWLTIRGLALHKVIHGTRLPEPSLFRPLFLNPETEKQQS